jgi:hypothetical protein
MKEIVRDFTGTPRKVGISFSAVGHSWWSENEVNSDDERQVPLSI